MELFRKLIEPSSVLFLLIMLLGNVMDTLHEHGIEIVSPTFMNQRQVNDIAFIPAKKS